MSIWITFESAMFIADESAEMGMTPDNPHRVLFARLFVWVLPSIGCTLLVYGAYDRSTLGEE